jgi:hypothetical protein
VVDDGLTRLLDGFVLVLVLVLSVLLSSAPVTSTLEFPFLVTKSRNGAQGGDGEGGLRVCVGVC